MCALLVHADRSGVCRLRRETIAATARVSVGHVSGITRRLSDIGLLEKSGNGGRSSAATYRVHAGGDHAPSMSSTREYPPERVQVSDSRNPPVSVQVSAARNPPKLVQVSGTRNPPVSVQLFAETCTDTGENPLSSGAGHRTHSEHMKTGRARARKGEVPDPFEVDAECREWARLEVPGVDIDRETLKFVDYHRGDGNLKADWRRAWRNWMRKAVEFQQRRGAAPVAAAPRTRVEL